MTKKDPAILKRYCSWHQDYWTRVTWVFLPILRTCCSCLYCRPPLSSYILECRGRCRPHELFEWRSKSVPEWFFAWLRPRKGLGATTANCYSLNCNLAPFSFKHDHFDIGNLPYFPIIPKLPGLCIGRSPGIRKNWAPAEEQIATPPLFNLWVVHPEHPKHIYHHLAGQGPTLVTMEFAPTNMEPISILYYSCVSRLWHSSLAHRCLLLSS